MATPVKTGGSARGPRGGASVGTATITSRDNRWLKEFRLALSGGLATETGAVGVEGVRLVEEALRSGCVIDAVLFSEAGERHHERLAPVIDRPEIAIPILRTTDRLFEGVADTEHPQGVAALVRPRMATFDELLKTPEGACSPLLVVLAGVQDPGNVGTIICFRLGLTDAKTMEREFYPRFTYDDFVSLPRHHIYLKLLIDGTESLGFSAVTVNDFES